MSKKTQELLISKVKQICPNVKVETVLNVHTLDGQCSESEFETLQIFFRSCSLKFYISNGKIKFYKA